MWSIDYYWLWMTNYFKWTNMDNSDNVKWLLNTISEWFSIFSIDPASSYKPEAPQFHHSNHPQHKEDGHHYKQPLRSLDSNTSNLPGHYPEPVHIKTEQPEYNKAFSNYQPRFEDTEEDCEERRDMLCDNMMTPYNLHNGQDSISRHSQDSLARISSMTNSISPPLNSHGSLSPGN